MNALRMRIIGGKVFLGEFELFAEDAESLDGRIRELVSEQRPRLIVTPNVDQVLRLESSEVLLESYSTSSLRLLDGMPLVWLARLLGAKAAQRNTGADLLPRVVRMAASSNWTVALLGGTDEVGQLAASRLQQKYAGAVVNHVPFPMTSDLTSDECKSVLKSLLEMQANVVFVCLGSPKQEEWALTWWGSLPPALYVGAGAAIDFAAGGKKRAPLLLQRAGGEWVWRLMQEPRRLAKRYLLDGPRFLTVVIRSIRGM
ncbi:WecB/TagA/CpsF family glycosyltransferase [Arthrobacter sp. EH-1B-1]|uniref:WecB/TagA/CpsF family glycosyltransferase n=1 Tax=Arthrobacter vasquezii TaxID=2977629 RepID=A0ABT6D0L2_9MICC|nr:WecB/TagA/CpsF family glycosyltransferase [Arthrobacter vasquezii]MDF9278729.1 WecB/TagA/CpsF family glycosyltransferase [Arthrobacter vasquezii]